MGRLKALLTKEFILEGKALRVNMERDRRAYRSPRLRVEILRHPPMGGHWQFTEAYEGFTLDDCDPLATDHPDALVTWKGKGDLSTLTGRPVYLRFELRQAALYAFRVAEE